jgi:hypothetical protein
LVVLESSVSEEPKLINGVEVFELLPKGDDPVVVWEVQPLSHSWRHRGLAVLEFAVFVSWDVESKKNQPNPGSASIAGSFWPCPPKPFSTTAGCQSSMDLPIPRFAQGFTSRRFVTVLYQGFEKFFA